jgi:ADP-ribose pyrophosphatase YjhB (NUDIX family)
MVREISAGGVVLREIAGVCHVALIEPQKEALQNATSSSKSRKRAPAVLALPKGLVDAGEKPEATAVREVHEETGVKAEVVAKLADIKYVYLRKWSDGERVFKIVSFYLMNYVSGKIGDITPDMLIEVKRALWVPLSEAPAQMVYSSECKVVKQAQQELEAGRFSEKFAAPPTKKRA